VDQHGCYSSKAYGENLGLEEWLRPISVGYDFHSILRRIIGRCADLCSGISHTLQENGRTAAASIFNKLFFPNLRSDGGHAAVLRDLRAWFVARPLGGLVFGHYGEPQDDGLLIMGSATAAIGLLPSYEALGIGRPKVRWYSGVSLGYNLASIFAGAFRR
jgi:hypothetical protein